MYGCVCIYLVTLRLQSVRVRNATTSGLIVVQSNMLEYTFFLTDCAHYYTASLALDGVVGQILHAAICDRNSGYSKMTKQGNSIVLIK